MFKIFKQVLYFQLKPSLLSSFIAFSFKRPITPGSNFDTLDNATSSNGVMFDTPNTSADDIMATSQNLQVENTAKV